MPERAGEADRGRRARVGDRQDEVGVDRGLAREPLAHPHARVVHLHPVELGVGSREVEELPDAERAAVRPLERLDRVQAVGVGEDELARLHLAHELRADEVERARLGGDDPVVVDAPDHERAEAVRVAERDEPSFRERDDGVRALEPAHRVRHGLVERRLVVRDQRGDQLAVGRRRELDAGLAQLVAQLGRR